MKPGESSVVATKALVHELDTAADFFCHCTIDGRQQPLASLLPTAFAGTRVLFKKLEQHVEILAGDSAAI